MSRACPLFLPLQSWKPGVALTPGFKQQLQPQELQPCYAVAQFPSLQGLEPLALYSLQDARIQRALQPLAALLLNGLKQFWRFEPLKPEKPPCCCPLPPGIKSAIRCSLEHLANTLLWDYLAVCQNHLSACHASTFPSSKIEERKKRVK